MDWTLGDEVEARKGDVPTLMHNEEDADEPIWGIFVEYSGDRTKVKVNLEGLDVFRWIEATKLRPHIRAT